MASLALLPQPHLHSDASASDFRALEEDELMRERVLQRLEAENMRFKSGPQDVLEYAVYLGMQLEASALPTPPLN